MAKKKTEEVNSSPKEEVVKPTEYSFTIIDEAGNSTTTTVPIAEPKKYIFTITE